MPRPQPCGGINANLPGGAGPGNVDEISPTERVVTVVHNNSVNKFGAAMTGSETDTWKQICQALVGQTTASWMDLEVHEDESYTGASSSLSRSGTSTYYGTNKDGTAWRKVAVEYYDHTEANNVPLPGPTGKPMTPPAGYIGSIVDAEGSRHDFNPEIADPNDPNSISSYMNFSKTTHLWRKATALNTATIDYVTVSMSADAGKYQLSGYSRSLMLSAGVGHPTATVAGTATYPVVGQTLDGKPVNTMQTSASGFTWSGTPPALRGQYTIPTPVPGTLHDWTMKTTGASYAVVWTNAMKGIECGGNYIPKDLAMQTNFCQFDLANGGLP
jgi:hypothetical protein